MGQLISATYNTYWGAPDTSPDIFSDPKYDHSHGFPRERKKRKAVMTEEQMEAAMLLPIDRDYCAHHLVEFLKCRRKHFPWVIACKPEHHVWMDCQADDYILRMKEYERERRLMERAKKKKQMAASQMKEVLVE